ncbi:MAG: hypothetical protein ACTSR2_10510 [Candidatus Hodarchaeales archaeon]
MVTNETYIFVQASLILIRLMGLFVFLDFYRKERHRRFFILVFAILAYATAPIIDLSIQNLTQIELYNYFHFLSELVISISLILFIYVFIQYISNEFTISTLIIGILIIILIGIIYPIVKYEMAIIMLQILNFTLVVITVFFILKKWHVLKQLADNSGYFFILAGFIIILSLFFTIILIVFNSPDIQFIEYLLDLAISFIGTFVFLQLEYNKLSIQRYKMKDDYSHSLTQLVQVLLGQLELLSLIEDKDKDKSQQYIDTGKNYCYKIGELISKIRQI